MARKDQAWNRTCGLGPFARMQDGRDVFDDEHQRKFIKELWPTFEALRACVNEEGKNGHKWNQVAKGSEMELRVDWALDTFVGDRRDGMVIAIGQRCPFQVCRMEELWYHQGIEVFKERLEFLRHINEVHLPAVRIFFCPIAQCPVTVDRRELV